jgi:hypothetical protein
MRWERSRAPAPAAALVLALLVLVSFTGCGRLDQDAVSTDLKTLRSSTAEGMLVAEQAARSRAPADFIVVRTAELSKQSRDAADALAETPTEHGFQEAAVRGTRIGNRASEILDALHSDPGNSGLAANVARELGALSDEAESAESSL